MAFPRKWKNRTGSKAYFAWRAMRSRCLNEKNPSYSDYGARGIKVCERWLNDYDAFFEDMGEPEDGLSLDRIDHNGNYEPSNCQWADWIAQANNKRNNRTISHDGKVMNLRQWARHLGIGADTLFRRLDVYNMPLEKALRSGSLVPAWEHGTRTGYRRGCKCADCKAAHAEHHREMRAGRKARKSF